MGFDAFSPWHLLIIAVIFVILFGAKKLPDSARSLGRAMRILKAETSGLRGEDDADTGSRAQAASPAQQLPASSRPVNDATVSGAVPETQRTNQPS